MSRQGWLQKLYWNKFGKPANERALHQALVDQPFATVLEVGIGDGERLRRIAKLIQIPEACETVRYIGTDEFEAASEGKHLTLKQAHQLAGQLNFKASLIPGDPGSAVGRVAHKLGACDLVIIDGGLDPAAPTEGPIGAWIDRIAHSESVILACREIGGNLERVEAAWIGESIRVAA